MNKMKITALLLVAIIGLTSYASSTGNRTLLGGVLGAFAGQGIEKTFIKTTIDQTKKKGQ